ncbi:hypothetical protein HID58_026575 [Brassica napus]|uniref:Uncharacterized protein n=1 Tax=Brassica napus TaxID=3708 RepID=A0ABQ8CPB0_BRANA|nr:hypothetical protein HID58_026575 [Brassica napus]
MRGHVLPSSTMKGHVSRERLITTASHHRRRSRLRISRPNQNSKTPPIFTANIFGPLIPERIDRLGEISSTTVHRKHPKHRMHHHPFRRKASLSSDENTNNRTKTKAQK